MYGKLTKFILEEWKRKKPDMNEADEQEAEKLIEAMLFLLEYYKLECLMCTLSDVKESAREYTKKFGEY